MDAATVASAASAASAAGDDLTEAQAVGTIIVLIVLLVPVALVLAAWLKQRYARAIVDLQSRTATGAPPPPESPPPDARPGALEVAILPAGAVPTHRATVAATRLRRRVLGVQFVAGLLYWFALVLGLALMSLAYEHAGGAPATEPSAAASQLTLWPILLLPPLLAWSLQAGARERVPWLIAAVGLALIGAGAWLMQTGVLESLAFVGVLALVAMMLGAFLRPAVRGAGPPLIVALTVTLIAVGVLFMVGAALDTSSDDEPISVLEWAAASLLIAVFFIAGAGCAWWMLKRMARRYEARRFSDAQLALGAYWGLVTLFMLGFTMLFAFQDRAPAAAEWIGLAMLLLWALWRLALRLAMRWARHGSAPPLGSLLLLRVFKPSNRSEAFMDRFLARWRFAAPTWLIAGPDLAGAFMEPDEFFAYVGRQLERRFIRDDGTLAERLAALDARRDPDGRFRVAEMFCSNTMWKAAVQAMLDRAGVVLLDLREFTEKRAGTRYELCEILRRADFGRVLVLTDEAGDAPRLRAAIDAAWREAGHPRGGTLRVLRVEQGTDAEMNGLFRAVAAAAAVPT